MTNDEAELAALEWAGQAGGKLLPQLTANELAGIVNEAIQRAIISGPGVEPVKGVVMRDGWVTLISNDALLIPGDLPLYLAAPSAPVQERGPWRARVTTEEHPRTFVESDDFTHDVRLYVDGDFSDKEQRMTYAQEIARRLNQHCAPVQAVPDWQPISTAPKDGTQILALTNGGDIYAVSYDDIFSAPWRLINEFGFNEHVMTNWMPLPQPPKEIGE